MESLSGPPADSSNPASFPSQPMPVLDWEWWSLDIPDPQVDAEAYPAGLRPPLHSTVLAIDTAAETPHPEIPIAASNIFAKADTNRNWRQGGMSMNVPLDHSLQYTETHATSDFLVPSTLPDNYSLPTVVQYQERASTEILQQSQNSGAGPTATSSRSPRKPRHRCSICRLDFAQKRGVTRHYRDVHEVSLCLHCSGFKWHRRHQLKEHLQEQHPDIHVPAALAEATRYRRRATIISNSLQGQQAFPPAIEFDRSRWGEHLLQPLPPPLLPVLEGTNVTRRREFARELALFDATYAHVAFSSTEVRMPPPNSVDVSFWR
ncbi:hypothetical protein F5888DRAFT_366972 [Russula emetica]|nr:hypothetical protein F5888DRAFT_366972 [Russula emetica]